MPDFILANLQVLNGLFRLVLIFILSFVTSMVQSQEFKLAGFSWGYYPSSPVKESQFNQEVQLNEYEVFFNLPKKLKNNKTIFINGLSYAAVAPKADNDSLQNIDGLNLQVLGYKFMSIHKMRASWSGVIVINPALASAFNGPLEEDDFIFSTALYAFNKKSDRFTYGFGLARSFRFGNPIFLPIFKTTAKLKKHNIDLFFPQHLKYEYHLGKLEIGLSMRVNGSLFNTNYLNVGSADVVDKIAYSRILLGPTVEYKIGRMVKLSAQAGLAAARSMVLQNTMIDDIDLDVENGPFFGISINIIAPDKAR